MTRAIGPQYGSDDLFKAAARLHQSKYRANILDVDYSEYGNRLIDEDGRALINYYDGLGVREALRKRYRKYSKMRDADLLRSEHIPFNMLAPLIGQPNLARLLINDAFGLRLHEPFSIKIEWAPTPKQQYLDDMTSFDTYIQGNDVNGNSVGIGIEVKYTERGYRMGAFEAIRVKDPHSTYWATTHESGIFLEDGTNELGENDLRQIWRNHLLGLAMVKHNDISRFVSVTLYPSGNKHFSDAMARYHKHLKSNARHSAIACTFERFIECIHGDNEIEKWKQFLSERYIVNPSE